MTASAARQEGRARLFRRPRHLRHPALAADDLWLRGRHLHRRSRPGRGTGAGAQEGRRCSGVKREIFIDDLRETFVRDFVFPMFRANALYEGQYLLGTSIARPLIAKRQIEIAEQGRRRRGRPRRHRQGQRPGALRARLLRAEARHQDHRALARMGPDQPHPAARIRRAATRSRSPRTSAARRRSRVDANLLHSSSEGKVLEDPAVEADEIVYQRTIAPGGRAGPGRPSSPSISSAAIRSPSTASGCRRPRC